MLFRRNFRRIFRGTKIFIPQETGSKTKLNPLFQIFPMYKTGQNKPYFGKKWRKKTRPPEIRMLFRRNFRRIFLEHTVTVTLYRSIIYMSIWSARWMVHSTDQQSKDKIGTDSSYQIRIS